MNAHIVFTLICALAILVGMVGIIVPVLPGSLLIAVSLLGWALVVQEPVGWVAFAVGIVLLAAGMASSAVLTGRTLKVRRIPKRSVVAGLLLAVVGFFVVPGVGLILGFALGMFLSEFQRHGAVKPAISSSAAALKAIGWGVLAEFGFASLASGTWIAGVLVYFLSQ